MNKVANTFATITITITIPDVTASSYYRIVLVTITTYFSIQRSFY